MRGGGLPRPGFIAVRSQCLQDTARAMADEIIISSDRMGTATGEAGHLTNQAGTEPAPDSVAWERSVMPGGIASRAPPPAPEKTEPPKRNGSLFWKSKRQRAFPEGKAR